MGISPELQTFSVLTIDYYDISTTPFHTALLQRSTMGLIPDNVMHVNGGDKRPSQPNGRASSLADALAHGFVALDA